MIIEPERSGKSISDVCIAFGVSRATWYKWKRRYDTYGIDGLKNQSRKPHNIKNMKVTGSTTPNSCSRLTRGENKP